MMDILNLPKFNILSIREHEYDFLIQVVTNSPPLACPHCGCQANLYKHGNREHVCMDLPIHGKRVELLVKRQRYRCRVCTQTFWERLDHTIDERRNCTKRLLSYVEKQSLKRTFVSIAEDVGLNERTIRNIFRDYINYLEETFRFVTPNWLGIEKIHIIKPRCVLTNIEGRTLLDILPNRNKETVVEFLSSLPNKGRIQYFTMDMWKPYKDAVKAVFPKATIIVDKFHVVRLANQVLENIHKQLREDLSATERRGLMHDRLILLKRHNELTETDKITLDLWTKNYPILGIAYSLKESFFDIWDGDSRQMAFIKYNDWKAKIPKELQSAFVPLIEAMMNWEEEIFAYFDHRIANDYTESLNSLFRVINRLGRGYSFEALRANIIFTEALAEDCKPKYQKRPLRGTKISTLIEKLEKGEL
ncbi:ISL3 family transposase [Paenibacillus sp. alder61]|uniref:ISL3 family transposase n=1 Tax=Paenibacillus sp. alder61 TaxID=2862948 RepID=UPI001CD58BE4|nr:ISL3 family transposase [Paenibacillus sp. alder61]MCA1296563.1 ISL3 family transposase [Paenibacillus sp. alder61]